MRALCALFLYLQISVTWAAPVHWEFTDVTYGVLDASYGFPVPGDPWPPEPGLVSGSFIFDADTGLFSDVSVTTPWQTYAVDGPVTLECWEYSIEAFCIGYPTMLLVHTDAPLTNAGGVVDLVFPDISWGLGSGSGEIFCDYEEGCRYGISSSRYSGIGGTLVGTVVPVPAAFWLFLSAIVCLRLRFGSPACH